MKRFCAFALVISLCVSTTNALAEQPRRCYTRVRCVGTAAACAADRAAAVKLVEECQAVQVALALVAAQPPAPPLVQSEPVKVVASRSKWETAFLYAGAVSLGAATGVGADGIGHLVSDKHVRPGELIVVGAIGAAVLTAMVLILDDK